MTIDALIDGIIAREGGFVDHKHDSQGATKYGITKGTLARWRGRHVTVEDVRRMDVGEARDIYRALYIDQPGFGTLPEPLRLQVVDFGVNAGPTQAVKTLQRAVMVPVDGILGPVTRRAIAAADVQAVARKFWQERVRFHAHLAALRPSQFTFLDGWLNRCFELQP